MASHKGWDRHFFTVDGLAMKDGRSLQITKGQFAVVDMDAPATRQGQLVTDSFGTNPDRKFELRLGIAPLSPTRSQSDKALSTPPFKLSEVKGLRVDAPRKKGMSIDHFIVGYDGIHADSAIKLENGDNEVIDVTIEGDAIGLLGYANAKATVKLYLEAPNEGAFTNQEIVENAVAEFNRKTLVGGTPINEYIEATPTNNLNSTLTGEAYTYFELMVPDAANYTALAKVQAQYPEFKVERTQNLGGYSTYTILAPTATTLADFTIAPGAVLADCAECPSGFELEGELCRSTTVLTYEWEAKDNCFAQTEDYTITLADEDCGGNRLAELQAYYPELTITVADAGTPSANSKRTVTLTGSSGTANITIDGVNYLATYATSQAATAAAFVTTHGAAITTATGGTVTASGNVITLTDATTGFPTVAIANVSGNLAGTLGAVTVINNQVTGGCMTTYATTVTTNILCNDCSPLYNGLFVSEAPQSFDMIDWTKEPKTYDPAALMGISFKTKTTIVAGDENYRDQLPFIAQPIKISSVSAGYPSGEVTLSYNQGNRKRIPVKMVSRAEETENWGGQFYDWEDRSRVHFQGRTRFENNNYGNLVLGQESHLKPTAQYVDYILTVRRVTMAQSFSGEKVETFNFHIFAEVGYHLDVEDILNNLATAAGLPTVEAYATV